MVVDLDRSRSVSPQVYQDFMNCRGSLDPAGSLNTLPVPISGKECLFQTRYVFAYGMDNSDRPSYLLWPIRGGNGQFLLVDPWSGNYFDLEAAKFVKPIGIEHFFDAFDLNSHQSAPRLNHQPLRCSHERSGPTNAGTGWLSQPHST